MSYAVRLPNRQNLMVPAVALALGFAGATGAYVALDDGFLTDDSSSSGSSAAISSPSPITSSGANEASIAAAIGASQAQRVGGSNEASTAAAVGSSYDAQQFLADRGITLRRSAPSSPGGNLP